MHFHIVPDALETPLWSIASDKLSSGPYTVPEQALPHADAVLSPGDALTRTIRSGIPFLGDAHARARARALSLSLRRDRESLVIVKLAREACLVGSRVVSALASCRRSLEGARRGVIYQQQTRRKNK